MNPKALTNHYPQLTAEERFRLILAAGTRGDEAEQHRLKEAGKCMTLTMPDHAPMAHALHELAELTYLEVVEDAANYTDMLNSTDDRGAADERSPSLRYFDLALAYGYMLKTKVAGWTLFCERMNVPPLALWRELPGFDRLQCALSRAEKAAFLPEGMVRWLNRIRPSEKPEATETDLPTADKYADDAEATFRGRIEWWGGE